MVRLSNRLPLGVAGQNLKKKDFCITRAPARHLPWLGRNIRLHGACPVFNRGFSGIHSQPRQEATWLIIASADFSHLLLRSTPIIQDQLLTIYWRGTAFHLHKQFQPTQSVETENIHWIFSKSDGISRARDGTQLMTSCIPPVSWSWSPTRPRTSPKTGWLRIKKIIKRKKCMQSVFTECF